MSVVAVAAAMSAVLAGCSSGASDVEGDRTVSVQGTDYTIPSDPQRIVSIFNAATQALIEAGGADRIVAAQDLSLNLVPAANRAAYKAIPAKIDMEGSAESQASYNPDLFVSVDFVEPGLNDELAKFAPVAIMQVSGKGRPDWKGRSKAAGEILGTSDKITELETALTARQADIKARFADVLGTKTVTVLDSYEQGNLYAYGTKSMVGTLFNDAGVRFAPSVTGDGTTPDTNPGEFESSAEKLGTFLDADIVLVVSDYDRKHDEFQSALVNNPLLANSGKPVQSLGMGQISSYAQANFLLDSLEKALTAARAQK